jgi:hypothetical protein
VNAVIIPGQGAACPARVRALEFLERLRAFRHERVLPVTTSMRDDDALEVTWLAPPHVSLRTWLERERSLPFLECGRVLAELAHALSVAHAAGIAHGALDPSRVLWSELHVLVEGLGASQLLAIVEGGSGEPDCPGDVRAWGALAYQVVTGEVHAPGTLPPNALRPHMPPGLAALIVRCLDEPARRPLSGELARFMAGLVTPPAHWRAPMLVRQAEYLISTEPPPWTRAQSRLERALAIDPLCPGAARLAAELSALRDGLEGGTLQS